jgi:hypothetical protein
MPDYLITQSSTENYPPTDRDEALQNLGGGGGPVVNAATPVAAITTYVAGLSVRAQQRIKSQAQNLIVIEVGSITAVSSSPRNPSVSTDGTF